MATIGTLNVNIVLNNAQFLTQINRTTQATNRAMQQMQRSVGNLDRAFLVLRRTFLSFFAVSAVSRGVRDVANYADAWKLATNQVAAANSIATLQSRSMERLNELAAESRTSLTDTAELYARLLRSTEGLAKSEEEVAEVTKTVTQAFKAGGASMQEAANGARQLGQSLASGIFQGDELRSIRENAPLLAQAIAEEFNTTIGGLKALGAEGKLTADRVFKAILQNAKPIRDAFAATNATIGDSFQILNDAITEYIGEMDKANGVSSSFTKTLIALAKALRDANKAPTGTSKTQNFWVDTKIVFNAIADGLNKLTGLTNKGATEDIKEFFQSVADVMHDAKVEAELLTDAVETFASTQARTGVGGVNLPNATTFQTGGGRGFTGVGIGGFERSKEQLDAIMQWRTEANGAAGDMARLTAAANEGADAFAEMTDRIEAETFMLKQKAPLNDAEIKSRIEEYVATQRSKRGLDDLIDSVEEYRDLQTELFQTRLLQVALNFSISAYRELKIHLDALNMATRAGVDINTEFGRGWVVLAEDVIRAKQVIDAAADRMDEVAQTINSTVNAAISSVSSAFADAVVEGENFRDMLDGLLKDLAKLAINQVFQLFLKQMIGQVGTTGTAGTGLLGVTGLHSGGIVGNRVGGRSVPAAVFAGAPRLHGGGAFFGGAEFPAILQRGEGVFTPEQMKALGGGTTNNFTVINQAPNTTATEERQSNASGGTDITVFIRQAMTKEIGDPASSVHKSLKSNFGLSQAGVRR